MGYSFEIEPRPEALGGGWRLRLLHGSEEIGGGVFPAGEGDDGYQEAYETGLEWVETRPAEEIQQESGRALYEAHCAQQPTPVPQPAWDDLSDIGRSYWNEKIIAPPSV